MKIETKNLDKHEKYINFKLNQTMINELIIGDQIKLIINEEIVMQDIIQYGDNCHVQIIIQEKSGIRESLTPEQMEEAKLDYIEKLEAIKL